jgi:hypothetical protein
MNAPSGSELIDANIALLQQALSLLARVDQERYSRSPSALAPHRMGSHLRHVMEFYECFLDGLATSQIDYDARKHDPSIESDRNKAADQISLIIFRLQAASWVPSDRAVAVRMDNCARDIYVNSSVGRELQALTSHTIHHFALIAVALRLHGVELEHSFGMSPSTLRFQSATPGTPSAEASS